MEHTLLRELGMNELLMKINVLLKVAQTVQLFKLNQLQQAVLQQQLLVKLLLKQTELVQIDNLPVKLMKRSLL
jgi:hypothetical protein